MSRASPRLRRTSSPASPTPSSPSVERVAPKAAPPDPPKLLRVANRPASPSSPSASPLPSLPWWAWRVLDDAGLRALDQYKYTGTDLSLLVELCLRAWWNWLIEFVPRWVAPNLLTLLGFLALLFVWAASLALCPLGLGCDLPPWLLLTAAGALLFYQTTDNLDGKQARRTGSSSALGELFDHGCDSLFLPLIATPLATTLKLTPWDATALFGVALLMFYAAHWEEYHSGHLVLGRLANPTEGQLALVLLLLTPLLFGADFFARSLAHTLPAPLLAYVPPWLQALPLSRLTALLIGLGCVWSVLDSTLKLLHWQRKTHAPLLPLLGRLLPLVLVGGGTLAWATLVPALLEQELVKLWTLQGLAASFLTIDILVCRIARAPFPLPRAWLVSLFPPVGALHAQLGAPFLAPATLLLGLLAVLGALYSLYVLSVVHQLTAYLRIRVFTIPH